MVEKYRMILVIFFMFILPVNVFAKDLGVVGSTYAINEKDLIEEIQSRARQIDWENYFNYSNIEKAVKGYRPEGLRKLSEAKKNRTFSVDLTYTLDFDITDGNGNVLYPKGYTFNPLDYIIFPNILVMIDGESRGQVDWFKRSKYAQDQSVMLLITGGSYWDLVMELKRPVFYATQDILHRFRIQSVPSVVRQKGRLMEVTEYVIDRKK